MITKREFHCKDCNKTFIIKGHWFNQMYIDWWGDVVWIAHRIWKHHERPKKSDWKYLSKLLLEFILLLPLQILDIIAAPFRYL